MPELVYVLTIAGPERELESGDPSEGAERWRSLTQRVPAALLEAQENLEKLLGDVEITILRVE